MPPAAWGRAPCLCRGRRALGLVCGLSLGRGGMSHHECSLRVLEARPLVSGGNLQFIGGARPASGLSWRRMISRAGGGRCNVFGCVCVQYEKLWQPPPPVLMCWVGGGGCHCIRVCCLVHCGQCDASAPEDRMPSSFCVDCPVLILQPRPPVIQHRVGGGGFLRVLLWCGEYCGRCEASAPCVGMPRGAWVACKTPISQLVAITMLSHPVGCRAARPGDSGAMFPGSWRSPGPVGPWGGRPRVVCPRVPGAGCVFLAPRLVVRGGAAPRVARPWGPVWVAGALAAR